MTETPERASSGEHKPALPSFSTAFIGREAEAEAVARMLERPECRLVTITGPGGVGKTRLAAEVARRIEPVSGRISAHFIDLSTAQGPDAPALLIADALGVSLPRVEGNGDALLAEALRDRAAIIVLDNFEHLVESCAEALGLIAASCPELRFVVTSRVALNVQQEWRFSLGGLEVDRRGSRREGDARRLFIDRALRVSGKPEDEFDIETVTRICESVEGLPLAIEMAAAWTRSMHERDIADEIQRRLDLLTTSMRDFPERQRSIEAVLEQSCGMLHEAEREVFTRLGVFAGGFTRAAAVEVAGASIASIAKLVDHSLVALGGEGRYRLHPLTRQFARERLEEAGMLDAAEAAHSSYYLGLLARRMEGIRGGNQVAAMRELSSEHDNLMQSWRRAGSTRRLDGTKEIERAATAMSMYLDGTSRYQECLSFGLELGRFAASLEASGAGLRSLAHVIAAGAHIRLGSLDDADRELRAGMELRRTREIELVPCVATADLALLPLIHLVRGDFAAALAAAGKAEADYGDDNPWGAAVALYCAGGAHYGLGEIAEARAATNRALELVQPLGDRWFADYLHLQLAECALQQGKLDEVTGHAESARRSRLDFGDRQGVAQALLRLGDVAVRRGDNAEARERYLQAHGLYRDSADRGGQALSLAALGRTEMADGDAGAARARYLQALELAVPIGYATALADTLSGLAEMQAAEGDRQGAAVVLAFLQEAPRVPVALRRNARQALEQLDLTPAVRREAERQAAALDLSSICAAVQEALRRPGSDPDDRGAGMLVEGELTRRELQVLGLLDKGYTNKAVARELGLTVGTVKWYCNQIFSKLGCSNRTEALARARSQGLLA